MKKLILLLLFIPILSFGQDGIRLDFENERFKILNRSTLLDRASGELYTNNKFVGVNSASSDRDIYLHKVRYNCDDVWCLFAKIKDRGKVLKKLIFDAIEDDDFYLILFNTESGEQYVSNFWDWNYSDKRIQEIDRNLSGKLPEAYKIMMNCPEGEWCKIK